MDFIHNIRRREEGKGFVGGCDFTIPRLVSDPEDCYLQRSMDGAFDSDLTLTGDCLVGRFCPYKSKADIFAMADEDGFVILQDTTLKGRASVLKKFRAHENAIFDLTWMRSYTGSLNLVTASGDNKVKLWDAETLHWQCIMKDHEQSLRTVTSHPDVPGLLVSGGRDGRICISDQRCDPAVVGVITDAHLQQKEKKSNSKQGTFSSNKSVTSLLLKNEYCLISGGFTDGLVKVWDLRRTYSEATRRQPAPLHLLPVGATVTCLVMNPQNNLLYSSCTNHAISCFDAINFLPKPVCRFVGHRTDSQYSSYLQCSVSSCGRYLACGSSADTAVHIWPTAQAHYKQEVTPVATLDGHVDGVHCAQWSHTPGYMKLASLSEDNTLRIWRMGPSLSEKVCREPNSGHAIITAPSHFESHHPKPQHSSILNTESSIRTDLTVLSELPNFVHNPSSVVHTCSPRAPKSRLNWLTALSPQNAVPSVGKVVKPKRPTSGNKRKSSKKLLLASSHFKTILKPRPTKL